MGRARRARRIAAAAAYGSGVGFAGIGAAGLVGYGIIRAEAKLARRIVGTPFEAAPDDSNLYGTGLGTPVQLVVLGDSLAAGLGAETKYQTIGGILAVGVAALAGRQVGVTNLAEVGAESSWLDHQVERALHQVPHPDVALITIGGNDVTHRIDRAVAVRHLEQAVRTLRAAGAEVVVGTCPDLGTVEPMPHPLRALVRYLGRDLAAAQTVAVVEAGGRTVSLADLLGREFISRPKEMFSVDRFHPSPVGYARVAAALLPSVCAALGLWVGEAPRAPDRFRGEGVEPIGEAAAHAVREPGMEVSATDVGGRPRGPGGRWALTLRRRRPQGAVAQLAGNAPDQGAVAELALSPAANQSATP
ncbi:MAG TPA: SGNH/GDSL hydrolase family protein [Dermatophilaceae bacterium]|nr:SGNH/GDSL hydrolase family protein [Dermatophilaceae bacterium]